MIAPWLVPTNVLGAIEGGSRAGLAQRAQSDQSAEAAARLKLSYDSLAQQADMERQSNAARQQQAMAAMALKKQQEDALMQWRNQQIALRQQQMDDKTAAVPKMQALHFGPSGEIIQPTGDPNDPFKVLRPASTPTIPPKTSVLQRKDGSMWLTTGDPENPLKQLQPPIKTPAQQLAESGGKIPTVEVPLNPNDSFGTGPKIRLPANDPRLNEILGTNSALLGTNWGVNPKPPVARLQASRPLPQTPSGEVGLSEFAMPTPEARLLNPKVLSALQLDSGNPATPMKPSVPKIVSKADYDALESGQQYIGPDGKIRVKK